jgi:peptidoglycan/LPS O-acetylase OafA/YrhL
MLLVSALSFEAFARALRCALFAWLGRISYSLYLCHLPIMIASLFVFDGILQPIWSIAIALPIILLVAAASYRWVECPAMVLGRRLTRHEVEPERLTIAILT